jgi:hypothetical protein
VQTTAAGEASEIGMQPTANPARKWPRYDGARRTVRRALVIAVVLAAAGAGAWWLRARGGGVPAARDGAVAPNSAGAPPAAGLEVTTDPKRKVFTREETLAGTAPPTEVRGVVEGPDGAPLGGIRVTARSRLPFRPAATAVTRADGAFRLLDVDEALLDVSLGNLPEGWSGPAAIARAGGPALRLRLERKKPKGPSKAVAVAITVLDSESRSIPGARVKVQGRYDEENFVHAESETTEADGVARLEVTDPSAHLWFAVERPEGRDDVFDLQIDGWKAQDAIVRLDRAMTFAGLIVGRDGAPVPNAVAVWREKDGEWQNAHAGDDGRFEVRQLRPAPVQAAAFASSFDEPFPPDMRLEDVDPRTGPVRLALSSDPGFIAVRAVWSELRYVVIGRELRPGLFVDVETYRGPRSDGVLLYQADSRASRYFVYARGNEDGIAFSRDLPAGRADDVRELEWKEGKRVHVSVAWGAAESDRDGPLIAMGWAPLYASHVTTRKGGVGQDDDETEDVKIEISPTEFVIDGVPDGTWKVVAGGASLDGATRFLGEADITAGGRGTIQLEEVPVPLPTKKR